MCQSGGVGQTVPAPHHPGVHLDKLNHLLRDLHPLPLAAHCAQGVQSKQSILRT